MAAVMKRGDPDETLEEAKGVLLLIEKAKERLRKARASTLVVPPSLLLLHHRCLPSRGRSILWEAAMKKINISGEKLTPGYSWPAAI
jgi:hypothetical protein